MSVSGVTSYNQTTNQIIQGAFQLIGVTMPGETASTDDYAVGLQFLNLYVKQLQAQGLHLWTETEAYIYPVINQIAYQFGGSSTDKISDALGSHATTVATAGVASDTTIALVSVSGMSVSDNIGIVLDSSTYLWTTISAINTTTNVATLNAALPSSAGVGNSVFTYTTLSGRALEISSGEFVWNSGAIQQMRSLSRKTYFAMPARTQTSGTPLQYYTEKRSNYTKVYLYPMPSALNCRIQVTYKRIIDNFVNTNDIADFPNEWLLALIYGLATVISPIYGFASSSSYTNVVNMAQMYMDLIRGFDQENNANLRIRPYIADYGDY